MGFQTYLYFREPGGMRIELNSGGWRNYQPDWKPVRWSPAMGSNDFYRQNALSAVDDGCFSSANGAALARQSRQPLGGSQREITSNAGVLQSKQV